MKADREGTRVPSRRRRCWRATLIGVLLCASLSATGQEPESPEAKRTRAFALYKQGRIVEALPLLEELAKEYPADRVVFLRLGHAVLANSATLGDPEQRRQERIRARNLFLRAQELGDDSQHLQGMIELIPLDGNLRPFSERPEVEEAMREGEAAFARGDLDTALASYQAALELEPSNYEAALFIGDVYYIKKEIDQAGQWFSRAIEINPKGETAYRYWGDALLVNGRPEEALEKYIEAILAEPYNRLAWVGIINWSRRTQTAIGHPRIRSPHKQESKGSEHTIVIDAATLEKKDGTDKWLMYEITRAAWKAALFDKEYPEEKEYRHTLKEEADALRSVAEALAEAKKAEEIETLEPSLSVLIELSKAGLLEAFVLLARADEGIARDYDDYRARHREKLVRYLREYFIHCEAQPVRPPDR